MFDKSKNNIKKVDIKTDKLYQNDNLLLSTSIIEMMDNLHNAKQMDEKNDYQSNVTSYIKRKNQNSVRKQYNPKIVDLYYNGILVINNEEYKLKDFFIVFDKKLKNFHIKCVNPNYKTEEIEYNKAIKFIDTTAFINLVNNSNIVNNKIIIDNSSIIDNVISNWDGYLHSEVLETDSIINKNMIEDDKNE